MLNLSEAADRWNLNSRKSVYNRINGLKAKGINIELPLQGKEKRAHIPNELLSHLDDLDRHLKQGGTLANYEPIAVTTTEIVEDKKGALHTTAQPEIRISSESINQIAIAVTQVLQPLFPPPNPIIKHRMLAEAAEFQYQLTTKELKAFGVVVKYPKDGDRFKQGKYQFVKVGKIGNSFSWVVVPNARKQTL